MSLLMILLTGEGTLLGGKGERVFELLLNSTDDINFRWLSASYGCIKKHTKINNLNKCLICQESDRLVGWWVDLSWACSRMCGQLAGQVRLPSPGWPQLK